MKILHTSDWHVGKALRGQSRADEHEAVLAEIAGVAAAEAVDAGPGRRRPVRHRGPVAGAEDIVYRHLLGLAGTGARSW